MAIRTYKVILDSKNAIAPEPVLLRQGDKTGSVVINATLMDNGSPVSLDGLKPMFKANTADKKAVISDSTGFNIINASGGEFTYQVPSQLGSVPGKIKIAYFSFADSNGNQSTFDIAFAVYPAADMTQESAKDWVSTLSDIIEQYNQWSNDAHNSWEQFVDDNKAIINSIDPGGKVLSELIGFRHSDMLSKTFDTAKLRGDFWDEEFRERGVNVKWFGAKGDGVTDDSDAIQAAVDTGSSVFVPAGTYLITKTISLKLQNFIGAGTNQTIFDVQNTDLFELGIDGRTIAEIAYFGVESKGGHADSNTVFKSHEDNTKRAVAYHFHDIEIGGGRFKYAFNLTDSFRTTINKIGMSNVFNPFLLRGQIVQTAISDVTCNIDTVELGALNDYNTGIEIVGDSHYGNYKRPESVRLSNVNFVGYYLGYNIKDVLYFVSDKFECDYCVNGIRTYSTDGGVTFTNGWIAVQNRRNTQSIGIDVIPSVKNILKPVSLNNINITGLSGIDATSVAVRVGYEENKSSWFKQGVTAQNLWISAASDKFKYAVQSNRAKMLTLDGIRVTNDTAQTDFCLVHCESYSLKNLSGQTASVTTDNGDNSTIENCNISDINIIGSYPQYYNNNGILRATNRSIKVTSTDTSANYTNNLSVNSGSLWVNNTKLMYKFGDPTNNTDGSRVIRIADVTSLPNPDASVRGDIYTLKGDTDQVYICVKRANIFVWKKII